jgi:ABC-type transporter Mla maintaining outer membrane lipid asymmetry permease subunit MlaE
MIELNLLAFIMGIMGGSIFIVSWQAHDAGYNRDFFLNFGKFGFWLTFLALILVIWGN